MFISPLVARLKGVVGADVCTQRVSSFVHASLQDLKMNTLYG